MSDILDDLIGEQPLEKDERKLVDLAYSRLDIFERSNRAYHDEAKGAREVYRLRDPGQDLPKEDDAAYYTPETEEAEAEITSNQNRDKRTLQLHTLKSTIKNSVADQMLAMPVPKLVPETPEKKNIATALQDALRYVIYDVNKYDRLHRRRVEDFYVSGTSVIEIGWDENLSFGQGDISLIRWPIEAFCWDPKAEDIQDARALIKVSWHPLSWYKDHYANGRYVQGEDNMYNDVGVPDTQLLQDQPDEARAMLMEYWYRTYVDGKYHINVAHIAGHCLLEHKKDVYAHGLYPFNLDAHSLIEGQPAGEGLIGELVNMMRYINRYAKYLDTNLRLSSKAKMLTRRDAGIDVAAVMDWDKDGAMGDSIQKGVDWDWLSNPPLNGMIVNQMMNMQAELKQDSGANQFTRGETTGNVTSGKALLALQQAGGKIGQLNSGVLNAGFGQIVWQVLCLMQEFYDNDRLRRITGRDENFDFFGSDMTEPRYAVQVEVQPKDPARIQAQNQMFIDMYTMAAQAQQYFPLSALVELLNVDGKDQILPVIQTMESKADQMKKLSEQNVQLIDELTKMQKENDSLKQMQTQSTSALATMGRSPQVNQGRKAVI